MSKNDDKMHMIWVMSPEGEKVCFELFWDAGAADWARAFRLIMMWAGFGKETIDNYLPKEDDLWEEILGARGL